MGGLLRLGRGGAGGRWCGRREGGDWEWGWEGRIWVGWGGWGLGVRVGGRGSWMARVGWGREIEYPSLLMSFSAGGAPAVVLRDDFGGTSERQK